MRYIESELEPPAPVTGGGRWRRRGDDIVEACQGAGGFVIYASTCRPVPAEPESGAVLSPLFVSTPPAEARVGEACVYQARAHAANIDGSTWYFEKSAPGMCVDRHTGLVSWTPAEGGHFDIVLCARNLYGAESRQGWTVCVRKAVHVRRVAPNPRYAAAALWKRRLGARPFMPVWHIERRRADPHCRPAAPPGARPRVAFTPRL